MNEDCNNRVSRLEVEEEEFNHEEYIDELIEKKATMITDPEKIQDILKAVNLTSVELRGKDKTIFGFLSGIYHSTSNIQIVNFKAAKNRTIFFFLYKLVFTAPIKLKKQSGTEDWFEFENPKTLTVKKVQDRIDMEKFFEGDFHGTKKRKAVIDNYYYGYLLNISVGGMCMSSGNLIVSKLKVGDYFYRITFFLYLEGDIKKEITINKAVIRRIENGKLGLQFEDVPTQSRKAINDFVLFYRDKKLGKKKDDRTDEDDLDVKKSLPVVLFMGANAKPLNKFHDFFEIKATGTFIQNVQEFNKIDPDIIISPSYLATGKEGREAWIKFLSIAKMNHIPIIIPVSNNLKSEELIHLEKIAQVFAAEMVNVTEIADAEKFAGKLSSKVMSRIMILENKEKVFESKLAELKKSYKVFVTEDYEESALKLQKGYAPKVTFCCVDDKHIKFFDLTRVITAALLNKSKFVILVQNDKVDTPGLKKIKDKFKTRIDEREILFLTKSKVKSVPPDAVIRYIDQIVPE